MSALTNLLQKSGISEVSSSRENSPSKTKTLDNRLTEAGLSLDSTLWNLAEIMRDSESDAIKLKAIEQALKMHGVLKDNSNTGNVVNIIINDSQFETSGGRNPILFPREIIMELELETELLQA